MNIQKVCIIGAGTMGTGIAQVFAQAGIRTCLIEADPAAIPRSQASLRASLQEGVSREKLSPEQAEAAGELITWHTDHEPVLEADWVVEAVFEDLAVKRAVLERLSCSVGPETTIATNTSTFPISELAAAVTGAERFIGMHFINPAPAMKLVEVIAGAQTSERTLQATLALCQRLGKIPVLAPDLPGFIVNRLFGAGVAAALDLWARGASPQDIDAAAELGLGQRMGPLRTADLVGLDVMCALLRSLRQRDGHPRFDIPDCFTKLVEAGKLGRKTGEGFYSYDSD